MLAIGALACSVETQPPGARGDAQGPGSKPWTTDDIACQGDGDCGPGEGCTDGVCTMKRCAEEYDSRAPLGEHRYFSIDGELVVVSDAAFVDGYENGSAYLGSWDVGTQITDVAGGNLTGTRPQALAVTLTGFHGVRIQSAEGEIDLDLDFVPVAVAAGDVDADGIDELLVAGGSDVALCEVTTEQCTRATIDGLDITDVAVADVDGDGFAEPVFLDPRDGESEIVVWNVDAERTGQAQTLGWILNKATVAIAAGDLDRTGTAEILLLEDGGWWGWSNDMLYALAATSGEIVGTAEVDGGSIDVASADRDGDGHAETYLLRDDNTIDRVDFDGAAFVASGSDTLGAGTAALKLTVMDWDGDSPAGKLVLGPELVAGEAVPLAVLAIPPTERDVSQGWGRVTLGNVESQTTSRSETLALTVGLVVSFGADFGSIFKGEVEAMVERETTLTHTLTSGVAVGQSFSLEGDASMVGGPQAGVVLSCGCFHHYRYETEDPGDKMGGSGKLVDVLVPVGGQIGLWSLTRYNAMAEKLGTLPVIPLESRVGEVASYPTSPMTLDGQSIPADDLLFTDVPSYATSDVGDTGWSLSLRSSETNTEAHTTKIGVGASLGAFGAEVDVKASARFGTAYAVTVGSETTFSGSVPAIVDDPETPEDEYETYRYGFVPVVHRQHYVDAAGEDAGFYVVSYAVAR